MENLQTLGDVLTFILLLFGVPFILWVLIRAWVFPHARTIGSALARGWSLLWTHLSPDTVMSNGTQKEGTNNFGDRRARQPTPERNHLIAMGNNAVNQEVTGNAGDTAPANYEGSFIPSEAREMIRFQAKAEAIADLTHAGLVTNQAKAIETVYHCSRTASSRPNTPYQKAKRLIEQLTNPKPVYYDDLRAKVDEEIHAEAGELKK